MKNSWHSALALKSLPRRQWFRCHFRSAKLIPSTFTRHRFSQPSSSTRPRQSIIHQYINYGIYHPTLPSSDMVNIITITITITICRVTLPSFSRYQGTPANVVRKHSESNIQSTMVVAGRTQTELEPVLHSSGYMLQSISRNWGSVLCALCFVLRAGIIVESRLMIYSQSYPLYHWRPYYDNIWFSGSQA